MPRPKPPVPLKSVTLKLPVDVLERLDRIRGKTGRAAFIVSLIGDGSNDLTDERLERLVRREITAGIDAFNADMASKGMPVRAGPAQNITFGPSSIKPGSRLKKGK